MDVIEAGPAYAAVLARLHAGAFPGDPWDERSFATLLGQPGVVCFVDERGGFLLLRTVLDEAEILTIGVTAPRQGIGGALMRQAIRAAGWQGVRTIHLEVAADNAAARALYASLGFTQTGFRKAYYPDGGDALTLCLKLIG
ncbi:N-acetyltransferase GCN5 [Acidocella aquatica]|uniref:N-acetyltransferase GCN5 n=1 Tax=Acidocella aquatica TaxID=1922313 RepID=A0ABQ6A8Y4_9PROT|nr:GNAT family N-acetyltransferase [Acidocella aquatica]GLR66545.1 N-acetyltransferase GCN5 [Acidocella aquatica]